jgi:hypothetical protein
MDMSWIGHSLSSPWRVLAVAWTLHAQGWPLHGRAMVRAGLDLCWLWLALAITLALVIAWAKHVMVRP